MKRFGLILMVILLPAVTGLAQIVISSGTSISSGNTVMASKVGITNNSDRVDLSRLTLVMNNASAVVINNTRSTSPLLIGAIEMNSGAAVRLNGPWEVTTNIKLTKGHLLVQNQTSDQLVYTGSTDLAEGSDQSFIGGVFYVEALGNASSRIRTFPIGNLSGYFPVQLNSIVDKDKGVRLGFEVVNGDPTSILGTVNGVSDIFKDHYWQLTTIPNLSATTSSGNFTGSPISLSGNGLDLFFPAGDESFPRIVQLVGQDPKVVNAGIKVNYISTLQSSVTGSVFAIAKTENDPNVDRDPVQVLEVLTPNDDNRNDALYINNLEQYPENKVTLLDRYGVKVKEWTNYDNANPDFDFKSLGIGNYICIIQYTDATGASQKKTQMITVLK